MNGKKCHVGYNIMEYTLSNLVKNTFKLDDHMTHYFQEETMHSCDRHDRKQKAPQNISLFVLILST